MLEEVGYVMEDEGVLVKEFLYFLVFDLYFILRRLRRGIFDSIFGIFEIVYFII